MEADDWGATSHYEVVQMAPVPNRRTVCYPPCGHPFVYSLVLLHGVLPRPR